MPQKGGAKEERQVEVVDSAADFAVEQERQTALRSFAAGAIDVYWRLCLDLTGQPPQSVLDAKAGRMPTEYPGVAFNFSEEKKAPPKAGFKKGQKPKAKAPAAEPVSA